MLPDAPHDEFNMESEDISRIISFDSSIEQIAKAISKVFSRSFGVTGFMLEDCMEVAKNIRIAMDIRK